MIGDVYSLVGGLEHFLFCHILGRITPTDFHIFQRLKLPTSSCHVSRYCECCGFRLGGRGSHQVFKLQGMFMVGGCWWFQFFAKHRVCSAVGAINGHQHGLRWRVTTMVTDKPLSSGTAPPRSFAMAIQPPPSLPPHCQMVKIRALDLNNIGVVT